MARLSEIMARQLITRILNSGKLITEDRKYCYNYNVFPDIIQDEYKWICEHYKEYHSIPDKLTFLDTFEEFDLVESTDTDEYMLDCLDENIMYNAGVKSFSELSNRWSKDAVEASSYFLDDLSENIRNALSMMGSVSEAEFPDLMSCLSKSLEKEDTYRIQTGLKEIDDDLGGLRRGNELAIILARTGMGKSWILQKMALTAYLDKNVGNVAIISPEMDPVDMATRIWTLYNHDNYNSDSNTSSLEQEYKQLYIVTPSMLGGTLTVERIRQFVRNKNLDAVYIDGLSYVKTGDHRVDAESVDRLGEVSRQLMVLSEENEIPVVAVVQANRDASDTTKSPDISTIRGCDEVSHIATIVYALSRDREETRIKIAKNRRGKTGDSYIYNWNIENGTFDYVRKIDVCDVDTPTPSPQASVKDILSRRTPRNQQPLTKIDNNPFK